MSVYHEAKELAEDLCWGAIGEACEILLEEGGIEEVLRFAAILCHGEVIPAPVVLRLRQRAAKIQSLRTGTC